MMKRIIFTLFAVCVLLFSGIPESDIQKSIINKLDAYVKGLPQEKVYLHLDKPYYHPRDTVWLKGYLVDAVNHYPEILSRILYVDLIDESRGKLFLKQTLRIDSGFAQGYLDLPDSLPEGQYQIRAYTNWMKNFHRSLLFVKDIRVYSGIIPSSDPDQISLVSDLQFFPEGGDLVDGVQSRIGFKAVNESGHGIDAKGYVLNNQSDTVAAFQSVHLGMGYFPLKPERGETYTAYVKDEQGITESFPMPMTNLNGFVMNVDNITYKDEIRVYLSHNYDEKQAVTLIAHQRGVVLYAADLPGAGKTSLVKVSRNSFDKDGLVQFTLFDGDGAPMCERLVYINTGKPLKIKLTTNKKSYVSREKVEVDIQVEDADGNPVRGNFSLAVTDENQMKSEPYEENIITSLQLSSELEPRTASGHDPQIRGIIEQPGWYFNGDSLTSRIHLDILLMTQGWRRFHWGEILNRTSYKATYPIEAGMTVSGTVKQQNGKPLKELLPLTFIITQDGKSEAIQTTPDSKGRFEINGLNPIGTYSITAGQMGKEKYYQYVFDSLPKRPSIQSNKETSFYQSTETDSEVLANFLAREKQLAASDKFMSNHLLKGVVIRATPEKRTDPRKVMMTGVDLRVLRIDVSICANAIDPFQMLQGKVPDVVIMKNNLGYVPLYRGRGVLILLDGFPVDVATISNLTPCSIESVEISGPSAMWGTRGSGGVMAFYTRVYSADGTPLYSADGRSSESRYNKLVATGYDSPKEFYSPDYDKNPKSSTPDHRSTIYWQPSVITDEDGKASVRFWNSDETNTTISVSLEGMNYDGKAAAARMKYKINSPK